MIQQDVYAVKLKLPNFQFKTFHWLGSKEQIERKADDKARQLKATVHYVRKQGNDEYFTNIENIKLNQEPLGDYLGNGTYEKDINLTEMLGLSKKKKKERV